MNFSTKDINFMFRIAVAVLHLGNITFTGASDDPATVVTNGNSGTSLEKAATAIGVSATELSQALTIKVLLTGKERTKKPLNATKSRTVRDSLSKWLYNRMFNWLVARISKSMKPDPNINCSYIGVLDIFGFEIFEHNSFEQLCINFCNEKLQANFNVNVFQKEQELYAKEGIKAKRLEWVSNQHVMDLIEKKPKGIFPALDNQWKMGQRGSDATFLSKCEKDLIDVKAFVGYGPKNPHLKKGQFGVVHYAGKVFYQSAGFLEKNSDAMTVNMEELVGTSSNSYISSLHSWALAGGEVAKTSVAGGSARKKSVSGQFTSQLKILMETIGQTAPSYVRCIKPNSVKKPNVLEAKLTLEQLRYAGVFQAVTIRQTGYPFRLSHLEFVQRFRVLFSSIPMTPSTAGLSKHEQDAHAAFQLLLPQFPKTVETKKTPGFEFEMEVGRTKVFYRAPTHRVIESKRRKLLSVKALIIEKVYRGLESRKLLNALKSSKAELIQAMSYGITANQAYYMELKNAVEKASKLRFKLNELQQSTKMLTLLTKQKNCRAALKNLIVVNLSRAQLTSTLTRADALGMATLEDPVYDICQRALKSVDERVKAKHMLKQGVKQYDSTLLDQVDALRLPWVNTACPFCTEKEINLMKQARIKIADEVSKMKDIVSAIQMNRATAGANYGKIGNIGLQEVSVDHLQQVLAADAESTYTPVTATGKHTMEVAKFTVTLRTFLIRLRDGGDTTWEDVQSLMNEVNSGRISVPAGIKEEITAVLDEIQARERSKTLIKELTLSLSKNGLTMKMLQGRESFKKNIHTTELSDLIQGCVEEEALNGRLNQELNSLMETAKILGGMRNIVSNHCLSDTELQALHSDTSSPPSLPYGLADVTKLHFLRTSLKQMQTNTLAQQHLLAVHLCENECLLYGLIVEGLDMVASLLYCLETQRFTGTIKALNHSSYNIAGLNAGLSILKKLSQAKTTATTASMVVLGEVCEQMIVLRTALHTYDIKGVRSTSEALRVKYGGEREDRYNYLSYISQEMKYANEFCNKNENTIELNRALSTGRATRDGDYLDTSTLKVTELERIIATTKNDCLTATDTRTKEEQMAMEKLVDGSEIVLSIRQLLKNDCWVRLAEHAQSYRRGDMHTIPDMCHDEMKDMCIAALTLDCLESLRNAVRTSDIQTTEDALVPCLELNSTDERTIHFVDWGRKVLEQLMLLESSCTEVLLTPTKESLRTINQACKDYKYFSPKARQVAQYSITLERLDEGAIEGCRTLDRQKLIWVTGIAKKPENATIVHLAVPELQQCYYYVSLSTNQLLRLKMDLALASKDPLKVVNAMWCFKQEFFSRFGTLYGLKHYSGLKDKKRFAKRHGIFVRELYHGMLEWQATPLHTSISNHTERRVRIGAIQCFHLITGYMEIDTGNGSRKNNSTSGSKSNEERSNDKAKQLCDLAIRVYGLRDEIYIQLMKQLTNNPESQSRHRGWKLMEVCLHHFPPSDQLENFLDYFCRLASRIKCVKLMYSRIYLGADQLSIDKTLVSRRLSTAGMLWKVKEGGGLQQSPIKKERKTLKGRSSNRARTKAAQKWDDYSTLNNSEFGVTEEVLLCKKKEFKRVRPKKKIGRHTNAIIKRLGEQNRTNNALTYKLDERRKEKDANFKLARERKEDLRRVLGGQSPTSSSPPKGYNMTLSEKQNQRMFDYSSYGYSEHDQEAKGTTMWLLFVTVVFLHFFSLTEDVCLFVFVLSFPDMHVQWLSSMGDYNEAYDTEGASGYIGLEAFEEANAAMDRRALHEQWQEERYKNDVDGPAFLRAHVRGKVGGGTPSENIRHVIATTTEATTTDEPQQQPPQKTVFSGLTARKIIKKTQPRHQHIRNYTMQDVFQ